MLNIRGRDTEYSPIPNCFILIDKNRNIQLFCDLKKITKSLKKGRSLYLNPENKNYKAIRIDEENDLIIWGIVTYVIKSI